MKTEKEIEEMAEKYSHKMLNDLLTVLESSPSITIGIGNYRKWFKDDYSKGYSQAQKDLMAEALDGFEEWFEKKVQEAPNDMAQEDFQNFKEVFELIWKTATTSKMKEIEGLNKHKERLKNIINKMTYGLYVSDPMEVLEEIKQGNFEIPETMVVEFLDLENIK